MKTTNWYLDLLADFADLIHILEAVDVGIEKDNSFQTGEFLVVDFNVAEWLDQFVHDSNSDFAYFFILRKKDNIREKPLNLKS